MGVMGREPVHGEGGKEVEGAKLLAIACTVSDKYRNTSGRDTRRGHSY